MSKHGKDKRRGARHAVKGGTTRLTSPLKIKPPEQAPPPSALISSDSVHQRQELNNFNVPAALVEASGTKQRTHWLPGNLMLTVIALALVFIAVIFWFVSHMPDQ
jgi:hypothetical protein